MKKQKKSFFSNLGITIILDILLLFVLLAVFRIINKQTYTVIATDGCQTAVKIQKIVKKLEPKSVLFSDFGSDSAYYLKEYVINTTYQYEDIRSITGDYNFDNNEIDTNRKNNYENQLIFESQGIDLIVLFCSIEEFEFCHKIADKIETPKRIILVKTNPTTKMEYDHNGYARCLVK